MILSVVIPAHNEALNLPGTIRSLDSALSATGFQYEILVVTDHSSDHTVYVLQDLKQEISRLRYIENRKRRGFGYAVRSGIENSAGDAIAIYMADSSDDPADLVRFFQKMLETNCHCVFGSRFIPGGKISGYPLHKLILNRAINTFIRLLFGFRYNDVTNAFKLYSKETLESLAPYLGCHFNLTVELPLKAIIRGFRYEVLPNSWTNRKYGISKLKIKEMGSRYLFIIMYCFLERWLSRGDYLRNGEDPIPQPAPPNKKSA